MSDQPMWMEQCEAARRIRQEYGSRKALGYLVGEKFLNLIRDAGHDPATQAEVPAFAAEIRTIFTPREITDYFSATRRFGALGHVVSDTDFEIFRDAVDEDVVSAAREAIFIERMRVVLLESPA